MNETIELYNGISIPKVGFGVYQISKEECEKAVLNALEIGYRLIDTAQSYFNEEEVGSAIEKSGIPREEIFLTTKIWIDNYGYEKALKSVNESMQKLKVNYIDMILLHQPFGDYYGAYRALEELYRQGKVRAIGVSNFYPDRLSDICAFTDIPPQVNQVETNVFNQQRKAQVNMKDNNVQIEAWAPFGEGRNDMFNNPVLKNIAEKHDKSVAQVILRWLAQRDIITLAKSTKTERMRENFDIFDFTLSDDEMNEIQNLDTEKSLFFDHQTPEAVNMFQDLINKRKEL